MVILRRPDANRLDVRYLPNGISCTCTELVWKLRTTERFRRINAGSMELLITFNDSKAYAKPWTIRIDLRLAADADLIEDVCDNEQDSAHTIKD